MTIRVRLDIDGLSYIDYKNLNIQRTISNFGASANFKVTFDSPFGRHKTDFVVGKEVKIYADKDATPTTNIFTGLVEEISFEGEETEQTVTLSGRDYTARLMDVTVEPSVYTDSEVSTIVTNLITNFVTNITTTNVNVTTTTLSRIAFNHTSVYDALRQLAELSGFYFFVDVNKDLNFVKLETTSSGQTLNNTNILSLQFDETREGMANKIWVYGDRQLTAAPQEIHTVGATPGSVFTLLYEPHNTRVQTSNTRPGSNLKGGIFNLVQGVSISGTEYLVNYFDKQVVLVSGTSLGYSTIPNANGSAVINYDRSVPIAKYGQDNVSIGLYGPKELVIQDKSIKDPQTARSILINKLETTNPLEEFTASLRGWFTFSPGQTIIVNQPDFNINSQTVNLLEVEYDFDPESIQNENVISVTLSNKPLDITDILRDMKKRIEALESADKLQSDVISRIEFSTGSMLVVGSRWSVSQRTILDSYIAGHPNNGIIGVLQPGFVGSIFNPVWDAGSGDLGSCLNFTGSRTGGSRTIVMCSGPDLEMGSLMPTTGLSVSFWFNLNSVAQTNTFPRLVVKESGASRNGWTVNWTSGTTNVNLSFQKWNAGVQQNLAGSPAAGWETGKWYHFCGTFNSGTTAPQAYYYLDNQILRSGTWNTNIGSTANNMWIGGFLSGNFWQLFDGKIDDVRVANLGWTSGEVGSIYNYANVSRGLVAHYRFNEGIGSLTYNGISGGNFVQPLLGDHRGTLTTLQSGGYSYA